MRLFSSLCRETSKCWTFTPHKHCIPCGPHVERKSFFVCPSVYLVIPFLQSALSFSVYCKAFHSDSLFVVASADVFQPPVRYWLKCSAWCEERGERGVGCYSEAFGLVAKQVLIALKVTRLRRPTLTCYPYCRQQTMCWPEEQRGLISVIMNGLRPMNQWSKPRCLKISQQFFIVRW